MNYEKQLLDYIEQYDGTKFNTQQIQEAYNFFNLMINQVEIDSKLKHQDLVDRLTFEKSCIKTAFEQFFVRVVMNKSLQKSNIDYIVKQLNIL